MEHSRARSYNIALLASCSFINILQWMNSYKQIDERNKL